MPAVAPDPRSAAADRGQVLAPSLEAACRRWPNRPATTYRGHTISYSELWQKVLALAGAYAQMGVVPGDRIVCQLPTGPEHLVAAHAAWAVGAIHVGADHDLTGSELRWLVGRTEAKILLFQARAGTPDPDGAVVAVRDAHPATRIATAGPSATAGDCSLDELLSSPAALQRTPVGPDDTAVLFLTSGTTGRPKGVIETLPSIWAKLAWFAEAFGPGPDDVHLMYLPISHAFGFKLSLTALLSGGRLVLLDRFSPEEALRLIGEEQVSILPGTPTHFTLLLRALDVVRHQIESLRWTVAAAAALPPPLLEQMYGRLGVELLYVYGCSEGFLTSTTDRAEIMRGSVGRRVFCGPPDTAPGGTVLVVDPDDATPRPPGEVGEIVFGARRPVRYWREPDVGTDGWYHTGDLGRIDDHGRLFVVGRLNELINRGGLKVAPGEVEAVLARHPDVADAAVLGTPDPVLGEAVCACVAPANDATPALAEIRSFLGRTLARHKLPDELCVLAHIPRTKISKVDRPALRALVLEADAPRERLRPQ